MGDFHTQPGTTGHSEAEGHAASLLQQAIWIEESVDGTAPPSQRLDLSDVDIDELRVAAQFIAEQAARIEELTKALRDVLDSGALAAIEGCTCETCAPIARASAVISLEGSK